MTEIHIQSTLTEDGKIVLADLPYRQGQSVEISIREMGEEPAESAKDPLVGSVLTFDQPLEPLPAEVWGSLL